MCKYEKELSAYMDGELSLAERAGIEEHLKECGECSETLKSLRKLSDLTASAYPSDPELQTEERMERSMHRIASSLERKPKQKIFEGSLSLTFPGAAAAALLLFLLGGLAALGTGFILSEPNTAIPQLVSSLDGDLRAGEGELRSGEKSASDIGEITALSGGEPAVQNKSAEPTREEMEELFRFLSERGASVEIKIELPTPSNFNVYGEPQLIRATEFAAIKESSAN